MQIRAILVIANVPSVFKANRICNLGYNRFGYPTMIWTLKCEKGYHWEFDWFNACISNISHKHTTNHQKKNRVAYQLYKEHDLPIIHINKKRAILFDKTQDANILRIPFRNSDLYLRRQ